MEVFKKAIGIIFPEAVVTGGCGHLTWVMGIKFRSSGRAVHDFNH